MKYVVLDLALTQQNMPQIKAGNVKSAESGMTILKISPI